MDVWSQNDGKAQHSAKASLQSGVLEASIEREPEFMKVKIKNYRAVGYWVWDTRDPDDVCGICQNQFDGCCAACKEPGDACPLLFGECTHEFHMHCIFKWLEGSSNPLCPLCKRPWVVQSKQSPPPPDPAPATGLQRGTLTMSPGFIAAVEAETARRETEPSVEQPSA